MRFVTPHDVFAGVRQIIANDSRHLEYALRGKQMIMTHTFNLKKLPVRNPQHRECGDFVTRRKFVRLVRKACRGTGWKVSVHGNMLKVKLRGNAL